MSKLIQEIKVFEGKAKAHLGSKWNNAKMQIEQQIRNYEKFISDSDLVAAMTDLDNLSDFNKLKRGTTIPPLLRFGYLTPENKDGKPMENYPIPLVLPYTENNALLFDMEHKDVPALFQTIALRFLLTMKLKVCKLYFIDPDFGNSFSLFKNVKNKQLDCELIYKPEEVNLLVSNLEKTISKANYLGTHPNLTAYNAQQAGAMAQPYHFVFIDDFPDVFTTSTALEGLCRLIEKNNATKAGIFIFINYSHKKNVPYGFDINRFKNICACISGDVSFSNWNQNISFPKYKIGLDMALPKNAGKIVDFINQLEEKETLSLDGWIEDLKKNKLIWKETTTNGIKVPVGYISAVKTFDFYLANDNDGDCKDFFALVAGRPRYGKTVLLHNVIVNSCMKYPPDELSLYLVDFAEGASFNIYRDLPHARALMLSNNKEYALRILKHLSSEAKRRADLYTQATEESGKQGKNSQQITNFAKYREVTGKKLPRIILVMDEFHYLFNSVDIVTMEARRELDDGIRQWGKFGISIILCTQDLSGVNFGDADTKITYRFALNLLEMDSKRVIRNGAAKSLKSQGQTIMNNTADGNEQSNVLFQCAFTPRYFEHVKYLDQVFQKYKNYFDKLPDCYICESGTDADVADNVNLLKQIENENFPVNYNECYVFVGRPDLLRDTHTRIRYHCQQYSNTLYIGEDFGTVIKSIAFSLLQIQKQSPANSKFYVMDCFNVGDEFQGAFNEITQYSQNYEVGNAYSIANYVNTIADELEKRKQAQTQQKNIEERIVLAVLNTQNCSVLKSESIMKPSETATKLIKIINEGAQLGIHCIIHTLSFNSMFGSSANLFKTDVFNLFVNKVFLKGADVQNMMLGGIKVSSVEENNLMLVLNNKLDGETYEQCKAYNNISTSGNNTAIEFISKFLKRKIIK